MRRVWKPKLPPSAAWTHTRVLDVHARHLADVDIGGNRGERRHRHISNLIASRAPEVRVLVRPGIVPGGRGPAGDPAYETDTHEGVDPVVDRRETHARKPATHGADNLLRRRMAVRRPQVLIYSHPLPGDTVSCVAESRFQGVVQAMVPPGGGTCDGVSSHRAGSISPKASQ
jgi:hypothetical protein